MSKAIQGLPAQEGGGGASGRGWPQSQLTESLTFEKCINLCDLVKTLPEGRLQVKSLETHSH